MSASTKLARASLPKPSRPQVVQSANTVVFHDPSQRHASTPRSALATSGGNRPGRSAPLSPSTPTGAGVAAGPASARGSRVPVVGAATARVAKAKTLPLAGLSAPPSSSSSTAAGSDSESAAKRERGLQKREFEQARRDVLELGMKGQMKNKRIRQKLRVDRHGRPLPKLKAPYKVLRGMKSKQKENAVREREMMEQTLGRVRPKAPKKK